MGEDWFVCECGEATSDYRGGQCGNCHDLHCEDCHEIFLGIYGVINDEDDQFNGCLAKCNNCDEDKKQEVKKTRKPRKVKKSKVVSKNEGDVTHVNIILKDKYTQGDLIVETIDGKYDVQEDGKIIKRITPT